MKFTYKGVKVTAARLARGWKVSFLTPAGERYTTHYSTRLTGRECAALSARAVDEAINQ